MGQQNIHAVIDIFAGAGGFSLGFKSVGFKIIRAIEIDKWAAETFKKINPETIVICNDIQNISDSELKKTFNSPDVLIGGPHVKEVNLCEV